MRNPKVDPNKPKLTSGTTPLFIASHRGHSGVVSVIASHPAVLINRGTKDTGISPLFIAVQQGREDVVEVLLQHKGIDVNQPTADGITPLGKAVHLGLDHITKLLVEAGAANAFELVRNYEHEQIAEMPSTHPSVTPRGQAVVAPKCNQEKQKTDEQRGESAVGQRGQDAVGNNDICIGGVWVGDVASALDFNGGSAFST